METLVLNASYEPLARISWQTAMRLLFQEKVEIVEEYEDREIRTVTITFKVPSIIRLLKMVRRRKKQVKFSRDNVYARDSGKCQYCYKRVPRHEVTYDHVFPKSRGGRTTWDNVVIACVPCNQKKEDRTPVEARMTLRTKPIRPKKLPNTARFTIMYRKGMPISWKQFLMDAAYWHGSLEE